MDIVKMLSELRSERVQVDEAILVLERLARGGKKRRGRPPKWMSEGTVISPDPAKRKGRTFTAAQREAAAERMRQRWAAKKKAEVKSQPKAEKKTKKTAKAT